MVRLGVMVGAVVGGLLASLLPAATARAACTDPPASEVNWQRCILDGLELKGVDLSGARLRDGSFFRSDLSGSDLSGVNGFRAKFVNTELRETRFDGPGALFSRRSARSRSFRCAPQGRRSDPCRPLRRDLGRRQAHLRRGLPGAL